MSKEKRRVPKLRFPGFTEDWEQRKFGEIYERASQKNDLTYGIDKIISVANMYFKIDATVGSEEYLKTYNVFKLGDIAFEGHTNKEYSYGRFVENTIGDGIVSHIFDVFTPRINLDINFWKDLIKYEPIMGPILRRCTKASRMMSNLTSKEFLEEKILCPTLEEQKLIGEFIVRIDKNITLHQRKLEHLNLKKKALLQKLFPKNGERYPELRFPGFADAWEQCKLGSIGSTYTGLSGKTKEDFGHGEAQYITYLNVFQNTISDTTMTDKVEIDTTQNEVKYGDVLFTTSSETPEEVGMSSVWLSDTPNIYLNSFCFGFRPNQKIDPYFLGYSLRAPYMRDKIKILAQGISRYNISKNKVMELEISMPNNEEQKLLGTFLQHIDLIITLHQRKLEHLQLQKKALLQQLFI